LCSERLAEEGFLSKREHDRVELYSVVLTLSRATLNAFALVLVLNIVVYLQKHFFVSTNSEKKLRRQSTPDLRIATQTRAANTKQTNASNAQHAAAYKELASDMFGTSALNDSTLPRSPQEHVAQI
jgi:hypothetical protein